MRRILFIILSLLLADSVALAQDTIQPKKSLAQNAEYFSKGIEYKYNEDYDAAIDFFELALTAFPQDHASMYELSALYILQDKIDEGFEMIKKAVELDSTNKWYKIRLATYHKQNRDYEAFISIYDELLEDDPNNLEYLEAYIDALLHIGDYERMIEKLDVYEENIGVNEYISLQKIEIYNLLEKKDEILNEIEKLSAAYPYNTHYMAMLAEAYMQNGRKKEAFPLYLKVKQLDPGNPYINISLMEYYQGQGDIDKAFEEFILSIKNKNLDYNTKAQIYEYWFEDKDGSENTAKEAEQAGRAFIETHPDKEIGYYIIGTVHFNNEIFDKAQEYYLDAIARDSSNFMSWYQLIFTDTELNMPHTLYKHTKTAMRFYPEQPIFYLFNGLSLIDKKEYEEAIKVLERGRKMSADKKLTASFDTYVADIYHELGNKEKMYEYYDRVLRNDPENLYVLNNYAYFLSEEGKRLDEALKMSAITIEKEPKNTTYLDTYAWILYKLERYKDAKKWMEKVLSYEKLPQGIYYEHYGDILYRLGETDKAVQNWKKAKRRGNTSEFIDQKIKDEKIYE
jgi:tetratricopeptide (TPR) repeat protein